MLESLPPGLCSVGKGMFTPGCFASLPSNFIPSLMAYGQTTQPLCGSPPKTPLPDAVENPSWYGEIWFRFSSTSALFCTHFGQLFQAKVQLWTFAHNVSARFYKEKITIKPSVTQVMECYAELKRWYHHLPLSLKPNRIVTPYHIQLQ